MNYEMSPSDGPPELSVGTRAGKQSPISNIQ